MDRGSWQLQFIGVMPRVRVPKTERIRRPQQCKSTNGFYCQLEPVESWREPRAQIYSSIYKFRTKTGSWQGLIGCKGFLVFTDWPVIIPLIGQSYHLYDWPELSSPEAPKAWLRDYFWPSAPLWACHGSGEVVTRNNLEKKSKERQKGKETHTNLNAEFQR